MICFNASRPLPPGMVRSNTTISQRALPTNSSVVVGAGDDCAVLDAGVSDQLLLFKTDAIVEGVHFTPAIPPEKIGHKALGRCLSDIAAMGGEPRYALVNLSLPGDTEVDDVAQLYRGMADLANQHRVAIVGGNITSAPVVMFAITVIGKGLKEGLLRRSAAALGDTPADELIPPVNRPLPAETSR